MSQRRVRKFFGNICEGTAGCLRTTGPVLILSLYACVFLNSCHSEKRSAADNGRVKPVLSASPNPVPVGDPDKPVATTQITWDTADGKIGELYVKVDREDERFVGRGPSGVMQINWIQFDSRYEFRLYAKKRSKLLARLTVSRDD
jgi:hypothetical protein